MEFTTESQCHTSCQRRIWGRHGTLSDSRSIRNRSTWTVITFFHKVDACPSSPPSTALALNDMQVQGTGVILSSRRLLASPVRIRCLKCIPSSTGRLPSSTSARAWLSGRRNLPALHAGASLRFWNGRDANDGGPIGRISLTLVRRSLQEIRPWWKIPRLLSHLSGTPLMNASFLLQYSCLLSRYGSRISHRRPSDPKPIPTTQ